MVGADTGQPQFQIFDKAANVYRDVAYGDMVILMRSLSHSAAEYVEVLQQAGVPVSSQSAAGYFSATEIADMLALLRVLDNPRRDIELAAVLRSAIFGIRDNQLMQIRLCVPDKSGDFYEALCSAVRDCEDADLRDRIAAIFRQLGDWRSIAHTIGIAEVIRRVYRDTGYLTFMSALPNGRQRRANLLKLHDRAVQFESFTEASRSGSLARFVEFLEKLLDQDRDWAAAEPDAAENAVRILSVHKSKGLEFPVVFLANLERRFNFRDLGDDCVFDDEDALGLKIIEPVLRQKFPSVVHELIVDKRRRRGLAEEMRILYVAVTRARERLILTASAKLDACRPLLDGCRFSPEGPQDWQLCDAKNLLEWILYGLADVKSMYSVVGLDAPGHTNDGNPCRIEILPRETCDRLAGKILARKRERLSFPSPADTAEERTAEVVVNAICTALQWKYPFAASIGLRAKLSVSELTHRDDEYAVSDLSDCLRRRPKALEPQSTTGRPDARLLGSAIHYIIQHIDLSRPPSCQTILAAGERAVGCNQIPASILRHIDPDSIAAFFRTEPGRLAMDHAKDLLREWPFTFALPADQLAEEFATERSADPENFVIVQGIVDMIIPGADGLTVIDFKSDHVESGEVAGRAARYQAQMHYYCMAAKGILQKPIRGSYLYFLHPRVLFLNKEI
jgi:ATP-dependent helicase/nuclease subunit A